MLSEQTKALISHIADGALEGLKFIPEGEAEEALLLLQQKISEAKFDGTTGDPLKILHSAVECGVIISASTPTDKDDKVFAKADEFLTSIEEGGNFFSALLAALVKRVKK